MIELSPAQIEDLTELVAICQDLSTDVVIIGAVAYNVFIEDVDRHTGDVDVAVALDLDDFVKMQNALKARGWMQRAQREHRWYGPTGAVVDIMPAGPRIRAQGHLVWPESQMQMSVVGFDHVFSKSEERDIAPGLRMKVIPIPVLTLLKIVSYLDRPAERERDVRDLGELFDRYELDNDERRFSDEVIEAEITFESSGAFLLGSDLGKICTQSEKVVVNGFIAVLKDETSRAHGVLRRARIGFFEDNENGERDLKVQIAAFADGFDRGVGE
jgi:predicted nucleotidyltransferase